MTTEPFEMPAPQDAPPPPFDAPSGTHWEWLPDTDWVPHSMSTNRCRYMVGRHACGAPAVASLRRGWRGRYFWDYCAEHLYGRRFIDGKVMGWQLVHAPKEPS